MRQLSMLNRISPPTELQLFLRGTFDMIARSDPLLHETRHCTALQVLTMEREQT